MGSCTQKTRCLNPAGLAYQDFYMANGRDEGYTVPPYMPPAAQMLSTVHAVMYLVPAQLLTKSAYTPATALQRYKTKNSKQIFLEKELRGLSPK